MKEVKAAKARKRVSAKKPRMTAAAKTRSAASSVVAVKTKKKPAASSNGGEAVIASRDPSECGAIELTSEERAVLVARIAYFRAEARGFATGYELEDWYAAEAELAAQFARGS